VWAPSGAGMVYWTLECLKSQCGVVGKSFTFSLPTRVEVELGCDNDMNNNLSFSETLLRRRHQSKFLARLFSPK
jgi:hypothetical protein